MPYSKANETVAAAAAAAAVGTRGLPFALSVVLYDVTCAFLVVLYTVPTRTGPLADEAAVTVPTRTGPLAYEADASVAVPTRTYPLANEALLTYYSTAVFFRFLSALGAIDCFVTPS